MKRILIIEDDTDFLHWLVMALHGNQLHHSATLADAMDMLRRYDFDVVITDLKLPDSAPEKTLALVRACAGNAAVVAITGTMADVTTLAADAAAHKLNLARAEDVTTLVEQAESAKKQKPNFERSVDAVCALALAFAKA